VSHRGEKILARWQSMPTWMVVLALATVCLVVRLGLIERQGLWTDEFFSLAMATGHSLEHPAALADPAMGDYVETAEAVSPEFYTRYLEHDQPAAGPRRVLRAIAMSGTSPPVYNLLLWAWTRVAGTGDAALRLFSVIWAMACFAVLGLLARDIGGRTTALVTLVLFTFSPLSVYYSTEGRMYSLLMVLATSLVWLTLRLSRQGLRWWWLALWISVFAIGLLTHYFFAFVVAAVMICSMVSPGRCRRGVWLAGAAIGSLLVLPWFLQIPASMSAWRVTGRWLYFEPTPGYNRAVATLWLPASLLSIRGPWGGFATWDRCTAGILGVAFMLLLWQKKAVALFSQPRTLLWAWLVAACGGLLVFDLWRGTYVVAVRRYALAGLPAALLLVGFGLRSLRPRACTVLLILLVAVNAVGLRRMYFNISRAYSPYQQVGSYLAQNAGPGDLIIVHSIPSGVVGVARYLQEAGGVPAGTGFASWVGQLGQRQVPRDLLRLASGRRRVIVVNIHAVGEPAQQIEWLKENAELDVEERIQSALIDVFTPRNAAQF